MWGPQMTDNSRACIETDDSTNQGAGCMIFSSKERSMKLKTDVRAVVTVALMSAMVACSSGTITGGAGPQGGSGTAGSGTAGSNGEGGQVGNPTGGSVGGGGNMGTTGGRGGAGNTGGVAGSG